MKITYVIIEDEERSRNVLKKMIGKHFPQMVLLGVADAVDSGVKLIKKVNPDLIFMDIQLKDGSGFDILTELGNIPSSIIFTTAYDSYAIKAFKFSALDYLLKPIEINELLESINRLEEQSNLNQHHRIDSLIKNINRNSESSPILTISTMKSVEFVKVNDILRCQAEGAYCKLIMKDGKTYMVSKVIKEFEYLLHDYGFYRVHQSHLVNIEEIKQYLKSDGVVVMNDGSHIGVSKSRKDSFLQYMAKLSL
ncbi:MAG: response regulator transcription factor [Saprospiraceae bacterium]|nr:response regulator transcription factor [Saprospiraceae bacterium]